jgi:7,8-didemethyl-8-hydroxy-5-deazariboflavin synthase CofG subunit
VRRAADGRSLDVTEAAVLLGARGDALDDLLRAAGAVRDAGLVRSGRPGVVTYSRKVFIPLTRLCRDRCHYCTFATVPHRVPAAYLERDEVVAIARAGAAQGCKEALFTLGDRPEQRWSAAREWLDQRGYASTVDYLRASAIAVLEETGLLPHLNPGVLSWDELQRLRPVAPSMGMMLETTSERLWSTPGLPHHGSPDKEPAVRLRVLEDAGRVGVPFTTGILIGIGETPRERAESLFAIRRVARQYGHLQEVIIQNFRAKPDTAMRSTPDAELADLAATVAVARLVLGPKVRIQAPPNLLSDTGDPGEAEVSLLLRAGIDDWGGVSPVTPDHVNPERPWPQIDTLARLSARAGFARRPAVARPAPGRARAGAGRPGHRTGRRDGPPGGAALAGAGRGLGRVGWYRSHGPARQHRHDGPHGRPARRLRLGVRRLGRRGQPRRPDRGRRRPTPRRRRAGRAEPGRLRSGRAAAARARGGGGRAHRGGRTGPGDAGPAGRRRAARRGRRRRDLCGQSEHQLHQRLLRGLPLLRLRATRA